MVKLSCGNLSLLSSLLEVLVALFISLKLCPTKSYYRRYDSTNTKNDGAK